MRRNERTKGMVEVNEDEHGWDGTEKRATTKQKGGQIVVARGTYRLFLVACSVALTMHSSQVDRGVRIGVVESSRARRIAVAIDTP